MNTTQENKTETVEIREALSTSKLKAMNAKGMAAAEELGIQVVDNPKLYSQKQIANALEALPKQLATLQRAQKYLKQGQESEKAAKEWQHANRFQAQNFQKQSSARIKIAELELEQLTAVLTGQEPIDNSTQITRIQVIELAQTQVEYKAARPETSTAKKVNLKNLEKKRAKAVEASIITGKECPKFGAEIDGEWVLAKRRQIEPIENSEAPQPQPKPTVTEPVTEPA